MEGIGIYKQIKNNVQSYKLDKVTVEMYNDFFKRVFEGAKKPETYWFWWGGALYRWRTKKQYEAVKKKINKRSKKHIKSLRMYQLIITETKSSLKHQIGKIKSKYWFPLWVAGILIHTCYVGQYKRSGIYITTKIEKI